MKPLLLILALAPLIPLVAGEENIDVLGKVGNLTTVKGQVFERVKITECSRDGIRIKLTSGQILWVPIEELRDCPAKRRCLQLQAQYAASDGGRKEAAEKTAEKAEEERRAQVFRDNPDKAVLEPEFAGIFFRLVPDELTGRTKAKFVYAVNVRNEGGKNWKGLLTLTIISKLPGTAFTKDFAADIPSGQGRSVEIDLFTGPESVHADACMAHWRIDADGVKIGSGALPAGYRDEVKE